ncbi:uncharacterized protein LOC101176045 [Nomascus leucogenys]|uniref:uncharacterized protein LOC101176045 n=1 Tax=Nomascus leucogenys TaxID=61853 RepID=UPI0002ADB978|nr:uncharacterized protein LOC101176045 [Nomascus leucogenys]
MRKQKFEEAKQVAQGQREVSVNCYRHFEVRLLFTARSCLDTGVEELSGPSLRKEDPQKTSWGPELKCDGRSPLLSQSEPGLPPSHGLTLALLGNHPSQPVLASGSDSRPTVVQLNSLAA